MRLARLRARVDVMAAAGAAGDVARERRLVVRASIQLLRIGNLIGRARRLGAVTPVLGDGLVTALKDAYDGMRDLRKNLGG